MYQNIYVAYVAMVLFFVLSIPVAFITWKTRQIVMYIVALTAIVEATGFAMRMSHESLSCTHTHAHRYTHTVHERNPFSRLLHNSFRSFASHILRIVFYRLTCFISLSSLCVCLVHACLVFHTLPLASYLFYNDSTGVFIAELLLLLLPPNALALTNYKICSQLVRLKQPRVVPEGMAPSCHIPILMNKQGLIHAGRIAWVFFISDILGFVIQGAGGAILGSANSSAAVNVGKTVVLIGLGIQVGFLLELSPDTPSMHLQCTLYFRKVQSGDTLDRCVY